MMMNYKKKKEEIYSFHLQQLDESAYSETESVTSSHKERIDSLFRDKKTNLERFIMSDDSDIYSTISDFSTSSRFRMNKPGPNGISTNLAELLAGGKGISNGLPGFSNRFLDSEGSVISVGSRTSESLKNHQISAEIHGISCRPKQFESKISFSSSGTEKLNQVVGPSHPARRQLPKIPTDNTQIGTLRRRNTENESHNHKYNSNTSTERSPESQKENPNSYVIQVLKVNAQEELEHAFGGRDKQRQSFRNVRTVMQAKIDRLFADASKELDSPQDSKVPNTPPIPAHIPLNKSRHNESTSANMMKNMANTKENTTTNKLKDSKFNATHNNVSASYSSNTLRSKKAQAPSPPRTNTIIPSKSTKKNTTTSGTSNGKHTDITKLTESSAFRPSIPSKRSSSASPSRSKSSLESPDVRFKRQSLSSATNSDSSPESTRNSSVINENSKEQTSITHTNNQVKTPSPRNTLSPTRDLSSPTDSIISTMRYGVDYLGFLPIQSKTTSLEMLQDPLKDLYYEYRSNISKGRKPLPGRIMINDSGLNIAYGHTGAQVKQFASTYPFQTIAIWAAIKLVIRKQLGEHGALHYSYAFLPLISDPDAKEKFNLYNPLTVNDPTVLTAPHPPMFACIMRKQGYPNILECHGFVCRSTGDAVLIAANLFQCLQAAINQESPKEVIKIKSNPRMVMSDTEADISPVRPPRRRLMSSNLTDSTTNSIERVSRSKSQDMYHARFVTIDEIRASKRQIRRSHSDRTLGPLIVESNSNSNITLKRSKSLVHFPDEYNLIELLNEVREKTGMKTVNDVIKQAISPKGMSFSEMSKEHRELLLKIAMTLSKDEIYKHSKNIMKKQKAKSQSNILESDSESSTISSVFKATKRSISRLGSRASSVHNVYKTDRSPFRRIIHSKNQYSFEGTGYYSDFSTSRRRNAPKTPLPRKSSVRTEGYTSCSDCGYESECSSKCYCSMKRSIQLTKFKTHTDTVMQVTSKKLSNSKLSCNCDTDSCTESEKCYCSLRSVKKMAQKMYDSNQDSGTETSNSSPINYYKRGYGSHSNLSDIVSSNEGSWRRQNNSPSNTLRPRSSALDEISKSRSTGTVFSLNPETIRKKSLSSNISMDSDTSSGGSGYHSQDSGSSQRLHQRQRFASAESIFRSRQQAQAALNSRDELIPSSSESSISKGSTNSYKKLGSSPTKQKVLLVSAVDTNGKLAYRGASQQEKKSEENNHSSVISMKKTAEIAALFTDLKLNQTTDMVNVISSVSASNDSLDDSLDESEDSSCSSAQANSSFLFSDDIKQSLGFLP